MARLVLWLLLGSAVCSSVGTGLLGFQPALQSGSSLLKLGRQRPRNAQSTLLPQEMLLSTSSVSLEGDGKWRSRLHGGYPLHAWVFPPIQLRQSSFQPFRQGPEVHQILMRESSLRSSSGTSHANSTAPAADNRTRRNWKWKPQGQAVRMGQRASGNSTIRAKRGGQKKTMWMRKNVQKHKRPLPQQVHLNQRLARCRTPVEVFRELREAKETAVDLNSVNIATALHRVAKTANIQHLPQVRSASEYQELVKTADNALQDPSNDFNPREMANTAWGLAKAQCVQIDVWEHTREAVARRGLRDYKPQELANTAWAFATVYNLITGRDKGKYLPTALGLLESVREEIEVRETSGGLAAFKPQELSNTLWSFATVGKEAPSVFAAVAAEIRRRGLEGFGAQDIANSMWAFVTSGQTDPQLLECVEQEVLQSGLASFNRQELANLVWAFAKADHQPIDRLLDQVEEEVLGRQLWVFRPQELSNLVWAFATAGKSAAAMFMAIEEEIVGRHLETFKSQELANIAWAFAKTGRKAEDLFECMELELLVKRDLSLFIPQELSNTLWSFAKLGHGSTTLFNAVASEMMRRGLHNFKTQELSNAVWAHATTAQTSEGLFEAVEEEALRRGLDAFSAQDLANMVWAFGKADHVVGEQLLVALKEEFERSRASRLGMMQFKAQELSNLLWACAKMQHITRGLFNRAEASVQALVQHQHQRDTDSAAPGPPPAIVPLEVPDEMRRFAQVGQQAEEMFATVEEELLRRDLDGFETQHLANMAWAFVFLKYSRFHKLSQSGLRLLVALLEAADRRLEHFSVEELRQLGQVVMATRRKDGTAEQGFALRVKEALRAAYDSDECSQPDSSDFHLEVAHMLELLGVPHTNEVKVFEGVYHIDIVVGTGDPTDGRGKIAVEVDGPSHFVGGTEEPNPHTALKRWLLHREGYTVLSIPFFDWSSLQGGAVCTAYMAYRLEEVGWNLDTMTLEAPKSEARNGAAAGEEGKLDSS